ncbi:hypothetical protein [Brevundimonas sp. A19_0]|uniref:hypothetical protein n=1 Tax=Brevundimonas sp. A19_0 TaxID=2821087 RepID=UPI001ADBCA56|nr:hypothetical protein [Brevundimonas sp. A19_0]MBO9500976.1 hypothetical protein [Brevundimonas sp. A19_0]
MTNLILNPDRAQYAPALQLAFINGPGPRSRPLPAGLTSAELDILQPRSAVFTPFALVSYGQFIRTVGAPAPGILATRDRSATTIIGDSGGFQFISKPGLYEGRPTVLKALGWLEANSDLAMTVDIPTRAIGTETWPTFQSCLNDTLANLAVMAAERTPGKIRFLNVLQGRDWKECRAWYDAVKTYPFEGWAFGGGARELPTMLRLLALMTKEGNLGGRFGHIHVLGTSSLSRAVQLTQIKRVLRDAGFEIEVTFDTATPSHHVKHGRIIVGMNAAKFAAQTVKMPMSPDYVRSALPLPGATLVGQRSVVRDILGPARSGAQYALDGVGSHLLVHHNIEQQLRLMEEAGRIADMAMLSGDGRPVDLLQRLMVIDKFLTWPNPLDASKRLTGVALDPLEDEKNGERS